jgi:predicted nucleotidyltransferase
MKSLNHLNKIKNDLKKLEKYQVVIYGSFLTKHFISHRSDIDIAIITQNRDKSDNISFRKKLIGEFDSLYDIKIFELLPLYLQIEIIDNYQVLFGNALDISEYFHYYRSLWKDMVQRIEENRFKNISEKIKLLERRMELSQK